MRRAFGNTEEDRPLLSGTHSPIQRKTKYCGAVPLAVGVVVLLSIALVSSAAVIATRNSESDNEKEGYKIYILFVSYFFKESVF